MKDPKVRILALGNNIKRETAFVDPAVCVGINISVVII
jgi:hypothetical protein